MPEAERPSEKLTFASRATAKFFEDNLSAEGIIIKYTRNPEKDFITFRIISETRVLSVEKTQLPVMPTA